MRVAEEHRDFDERHAFGERERSTCVATHSVVPIPQKDFQLPSGSFLCTMSLVPRISFGSPPGDSTYEPVK